MNYPIVDEKFEQLKGMVNKHKGQRCFVMGAGPSLNNTPLELLEGEILIGCNSLYKLGIPFQYYGVADGKVWQNHYPAILAQDTTLIISGNACNLYRSNIEYYTKYCHPNIKIFDILQTNTTFYTGNISTDITMGLIGGDTVIVDVGLQLAYYLGCNPVYLVGVDFDYSGVHHFDGTQADNNSGGAAGHYRLSRDAFKICEKTFHDNGREIIDCTPGGKLPMFRKQTLEEVLGCPSSSATSP